MLQKEIERLLSENNPAALKTPTESQMKQFHAKHKQTNFSINDLKKKKKKRPEESEEAYRMKQRLFDL